MAFERHATNYEHGRLQHRGGDGGGGGRLEERDMKFSQTLGRSEKCSRQTPRAEGSITFGLSLKCECLKFDPWCSLSLTEAGCRAYLVSSDVQKSVKISAPHSRGVWVAIKSWRLCGLCGSTANIQGP